MEDDPVPWKVSSIMEHRERFVQEYWKRRQSLTALCEEYGIHRKTGWKWVKRFTEGGRPALVDRSHRPHRVAHALSEDVVRLVIETRKRFPMFGPKKLHAYLSQHEPDTRWPALSTIGVLLKEHGLIAERRRRARTPMATQPLSAATEPNVLWCTDFKGCFRVAGTYCHPLTISDGYSRFLLRVQAVDAERFELVKPVYESVFREYGMPLRIRSDNGAPFAAQAIGGLSRLSVWWLKLGITPERIQPGHPEQNGRHERMHRTLKAHTARPPRPSLQAQQEAFSEFRQHYNHERPHEALGQVTPSSVYRASPREFPQEVGDPDYPSDFLVRRIGARGELKILGGKARLGAVLIGEAVGLEEIAEGRWQLWFGPIYLGVLAQHGKGQFELLKNLPDGSSHRPVLD
jgi:transposase InsO family protein